MQKEIKKVIIIDNYDSFTYNLVHMINELIENEVDVVKNDQVNFETLDAYDYIILSPGPGLPQNSGKLMEVIRQSIGVKKIFGVCLGLQAIGLHYGYQLLNLPKVFHGIQSKISIIDAYHSSIFDNIDSTFKAGRYHSWVIDPDSQGKGLHITSLDEDGHIMSAENKNDHIYGVQFHPESIMTPEGKRMIYNFLYLI